MDRKRFLAGVGALPLIAQIGASGATSIDGTWVGTLGYGDDSETFALAFKKGKDGKLVAYMWNPAIGVYDLPASHVEVRGGTVTLIEAKVSLTYDGATLTGRLSPIGDRIKLTPATVPPPTPVAPAPITGALPAHVWQREVGPVWATPLVAGNTVYVSDAHGALHAFDAGSGAVAWSYDAKSPLFGTPALDGNALLLLDERDVLHRIDVATGIKIWTRAFGTGTPHDPPAPKSRRFDYRSATPVMHDGVAYVGTGSGAFYALDAATGEVRWRRHIASAIRSTAVIAGGRAIFGTWESDIVALDLATGKTEWALATSQPISMGVVVYQEVAIAGSRNSLLYGVDIANGKPIWKRYFFSSWVESAPAIVDGIAYMGSSDMHALRAFDPLTGKMRWTTTVYGWSPGTPLVVGDTIYAGTAAMAPYLPGMLAGRCAVRAGDGSLIWRDTAPPQTGIVTGYACDPVLAAGNIIYASVLGQIAAYR